MPKFAANISFLFTEIAFEDRYAAAAACGFQGVECLFPYDVPALRLADVRESAAVEQVLFNMPPGDWAAGDRGLAADPARVGEFRDGVGVALAYAEALGCSRIHAMAGVVADAGARHWDCYKENLAFAADAAKAAGVSVLIEPINKRAMPGYLLAYTGQALAVIEEVARDNVRLQFDAFHTQIMEGDITERLRRLAPVIGHVQVSSVPDRHEPDHGELNYPYFFTLLDELGYGGWVGCEYHPKGETRAGLGWGGAYGLGVAVN